jgi:hypothetical protein
MLVSMQRPAPGLLRRVILAVFASMLLAPAATAAADSPLLGYWPMYESRGQVVHDISGRDNDGRLGRTSAPDGRDADWVRGVLGIPSALRFDGDDYVLVPDTASLRPQRVTVEAWVRADRSPGAYRYVVAKGGDGCFSGSFGLYTASNGGMAFYVYDGKTWFRSPMYGPQLYDGGWHHVAGTYDGKRVRLYVDGRQVGDGTKFDGTIAYDLPAQNLFIGAYRGACDLTFQGDIDEVRVWSRVLGISAFSH